MVRHKFCWVEKDESKRKKALPLWQGLFCLNYCRRSPNLPHSLPCSTIGPARLNFRVRDGNG
jgi:hypothetical protein